MLLNKLQLIAVFNQGFLDQSLSHVQTALETTRQMELLAANNKACKEAKEAKQKIAAASETYNSGVWMKILLRKSIEKCN